MLATEAVRDLGSPEICGVIGIICLGISAKREGRRVRLEIFSALLLLTRLALLSLRRSRGVDAATVDDPVTRSSSRNAANSGERALQGLNTLAQKRSQFTL